MCHLCEGRVNDLAVSADGQLAEGGDEEVQEAPHDDGRGRGQQQHEGQEHPLRGALPGEPSFIINDLLSSSMYI